MGRMTGRRGHWEGALGRVGVGCPLLRRERRGGGLRERARSRAGVGSDERGRVRRECCIARYGSGGLVGERGVSAIVNMISKSP